MFMYALSLSLSLSWPSHLSAVAIGDPFDQHHHRRLSPSACYHHRRCACVRAFCVEKGLKKCPREIG
uniref:Putative secreted protein n=1 Tax=Anopheles darlingi TaxID=43151 RepID=A0A2M4DAD5_ANODA